MENLKQCLLRIRKEVIVQSPGRLEIYLGVGEKRRPIYRLNYTHYTTLVRDIDREDPIMLHRNVYSCGWKRTRRFYLRHRFLVPYYICRIVIGQVSMRDNDRDREQWLSLVSKGEEKHHEQGKRKRNRVRTG